MRALRERAGAAPARAPRAAPDSAPERGSVPSRTHSRKWRHSIRSGSSFEIRGRVGVARARDVLAVRRVVLVEALVVDGQLALELHVVERRHPLRADHREAALLVRVEPRQVHVRDEPRVEAHQREHHVLHARLHVALAHGVALERLLVREPQDHGHVVRPQRPERVLVLRGACRGSAGSSRCSAGRRARRSTPARLSFSTPGWYSSRWPTISTRPGRPRGLDDRLGLGGRLGQRLLHEAVLAGLEHPERQLGVGGHRGGDHDGVERGVGQQVVERRSWCALTGRPRPSARAPPRRRRRARQLGAGQPVEVAGEVRAPVAEADDPDARHRRTRFGASMPRVTPRKSTTSGASRDDALEVEPGVGGHDHGAVQVLGHSERQAVLGQLRARSRRGRRAPRRCSRSSRMMRSAGDSRRSPTPGL